MKQRPKSKGTTLEGMPIYLVPMLQELERTTINSSKVVADQA